MHHDVFDMKHLNHFDLCRKNKHPSSQILDHEEYLREVLLHRDILFGFDKLPMANLYMNCKDL